MRTASAEHTESPFCKRHGRTGTAVRKAGGRTGRSRGGGVSGWSFQSDFTNEMGKDIITGRGGSKGIHAQLPKIALRGDFSLVSLTIS
ncbi:MAG: hypothetical protein OSJ53_01785 [Kineothrix sp.]|nr:hypothetical protein [Kineothrix sp.]